MPEAVALPAAVERYLAAFGPASVADVAAFLGMKVSPVKAVVSTLELRRFRAEDGTELLDVEDGLLPDPDTEAPVRFLPTWDAILLVHARRTQVLPEAYRPLVFHVKMPPSYPTFLVDGQVAGTWRHDRRGDSALAVRQAACPATAWRSRRRRTSSPHSTPESADVR